MNCHKNCCLIVNSHSAQKGFEMEGWHLMFIFFVTILIICLVWHSFFKERSVQKVEITRTIEYTNERGKKVIETETSTQSLSNSIPVKAKNITDIMVIENP